MKIIDSDDYRSSEIETMFFPGGEPHVKIPKFTEPLLLWLKLRTWADVGFAALLQSALSHQKIPFKAFIPYFPGARQDRSDGTAPYTLDLLAQFLHSHDMHIFDPHSRVLENRLKNASFYMPSDIPVPINKDVVGIIAPDEGAEERAKDFLDKFYPKADLIRGYKKRDPKTGRLSHYRLEDLKGVAGTYIIVDDICDGGGTFNLLVEAFEKDKIASQCRLEMFVSHGIFSKGLGNISSRIEKITTTDSWCTAGRMEGWLQRGWRDRLNIIPLLPALIAKF